MTPSVVISVKLLTAYGSISVVRVPQPYNAYLKGKEKEKIKYK